ncbi:MAG: Glycosyltransferase [Candidatus Magasanikbacteria bacterium GW2011_GWA2_45_39]|uniref:Glycosyltransferase n=1 Tax=Candidatus Magasanikbacteria bacterium GW2011_GWA2_45_39 TaxID=1619041 RepID=A0A0G1MDJ9_9BACT|nr:MAG: Glycosyltransferase [Candidatus Peregrinibacteria bacterium GW2011_GWC2_39_14]KKU06386.1 MAG: Glycosyltransferase [Candidatus Magasanikbacteria bacterium GW2011_GWA2_45_39]
MANKKLKLLVITQKVDLNDSNLGFFHEWLKKIAEHVDTLTIICLEKGAVKLPKNVSVFSLGKENQEKMRLVYIYRFYKLLWQLRGRYNAVFVHMNPEYVILGGLLWRMMKYPVTLWYVHKSVTAHLWLAEKFVTHIVSASPESCRLQSKKIIFVGHGINTDDFRNPRKVLPVNTIAMISIGRIASSKDLKTLILAVYYFKKQNLTQQIFLDIYGAPITKYDYKYVDALHSLIGELDLEQEVHVRGGIIHSHIPGILADYNLFLHASRTGSVDKVVLEALAAGLPVVTSSDAYMKELSANVVFQFPQGNSRSLAQLIEKLHGFGILESTNPISEKAHTYIKNTYDLDQLIDKILVIMSNKI